MHFHLDADTEVFRDGVLAHLQEVMTPEFEERLYRSGVAHDDGFAKGLVDKGYFAPSWPTEFGGQNRNAWDEQVLKEELMRVDAPVYLSETTRMVASIIREIGTPVMKDRIIGGAMNGDITIALGFTEPECGSDVAAAATRGCARRRRVGHQRLEDVHHQRSHCRLHLLAGAHEPREAKT